MQASTFLIPSEKREKLKILSADFTNKIATNSVRVTQNKIHWGVFINLQFSQNQRIILDQTREYQFHKKDSGFNSNYVTLHKQQINAYRRLPLSNATQHLTCKQRERNITRKM
jgi:hypothetical protein